MGDRLPADTLLDGEIVAVDESGRVSFNLLQHHRSKAQALLFYAFDVLIHRGKSLLNVPLEKRRKVLGEIFEKVRSKTSPIKLSETIDAMPTELVRVAKQLGTAKSTEGSHDSAEGSDRESKKAFGKLAVLWVRGLDRRQAVVCVCRSAR